MEPGGLQRIDIETEGSFINQPSNPPTHLSKIDPKKRWNLGSFWRIHGKALWSTCYWQAVSYTSVSELDARRGNMGGKGRGGPPIAKSLESKEGKRAAEVVLLFRPILILG